MPQHVGFTHTISDVRGLLRQRLRSTRTTPPLAESCESRPATTGIAVLSVCGI